jgi:gluconate 2-dehydrogenase alpha chain
MAYCGCYLDLDPTYRDAYGTPLLRMTLNWQDNDLRVSEFLGEKLAQIGKAMGAKSMSGRVLKRGDNWDTRPYQSTHINGGTAMGADPKTSVVNKYLQSWEVPNLFVLGANVFAHGIGYNPTGLVGGLAYWVAANIRSRDLESLRPAARRVSVDEFRYHQRERVRAFARERFFGFYRLMFPTLAPEARG